MNPCGVTRLVFLTISIPRTSSREHPQPLPRHTLADRPAHEINTPLRYSTARPKSGGELARVERRRRPRGQRRPRQPRRLRSQHRLGTAPVCGQPVRARGSGLSARSTRSEGRPRQRSGVETRGCHRRHRSPEHRSSSVGDVPATRTPRHTRSGEWARAPAAGLPRERRPADRSRAVFIWPRLQVNTSTITVPCI